MMMLMVFITIFLLVSVLGDLPVVFLSLFQKMFLEHLFRARHMLDDGGYGSKQDKYSLCSPVRS